MLTTLSIAQALQLIKGASSKWVHDTFPEHHAFAWQEGYGGFSYSRSQRNNVIQYIMNQTAHHEKITFRSEYLKLLKLFEISFEEQYIFEFYE